MATWWRLPPLKPPAQVNRARGFVVVADEVRSSSVTGWAHVWPRSPARCKSDTLAQIAAAMAGQAATADEVSGNIQQVDQAAGRLLEGPRAVNQAADTMSKGSQALSGNTARFRLS
ncbi:hypothetical protein PS645_01478 [Pseudomonas fluorescens]|uniref:Uncharacterized protein n=1 Tax=Pseudomonas fluorescens TaxID=294 RepID=A0A5E6RJ71_PSEFL|nr:hypothetical protein PS645_01478 [Pseudomonas fluorescens]